MIRVQDFSKSYGPIQAVRSLSFDVERGELFGMIGPDGAGKTTTMRTLVTLLRPDSGTLEVDGLDSTKHTREIRSTTGYMPQRFSLYPDLSINQNLNFFADLFSVPKDEIEKRKERLYRFSNLKPFSTRLAGRLSGGMKQKLALSCTLIHNPKLLVLDEPTTGVDPVSRQEFWNILHELKAQGITLLVSTPYMDEAHLCDRIAVMHEGNILATGTPDDLIHSIQHHIYALEHSESFAVVKALTTIPEIHRVQSFGDSLHITVPSTTDATQLQQLLASYVDDASSLKRITPSLEDVFIDIVSREAA